MYGGKPKVPSRLSPGQGKPFSGSVEVQSFGGLSADFLAGQVWAGQSVGMKHRSQFAIFFLVLAFLCGHACAQVAPEPDAPPSAPSLPGDNAQPFGPSAPAGAARPSAPTGAVSGHPASSSLPILHVSSNLVDLYFTVRADHGKLVPDLKQSDCTVEEDGKPQTLASFTARASQPLTLGLLLDTSLSQQNVLPMEQLAADTFLRRMLRPGDEAFLFGFDVDVNMLADLTGSPQILKQALMRATINSSSGNYANGTLPPIGKPKGTLLYDAVSLAAKDKLTHEAGRKALILLTDGVDEGSRNTLQSATQAAQKANAIVYVLLIQDKGIDEILDRSGEGSMRKLAQATGGQVFPVGSNGRKLQAAFDEIEKELRTEYLAAYVPAGRQNAGYRRIRVVCRRPGQRLHVQARQGYYAPAP